MSRFRSHWLAVFGGATLIALSVSTAFAHHPNTATTTVPDVSAFVHSQVGDVEEPTEAPVAQTTEHTTTTDTTQTSDHGACVSRVAESDAVGGDQENHGGAVSEAARVTCAQDATTPPTTEPADNQGDTEDQAADSPEADTDAKDATTQSGSDHQHSGGHDHGSSGSDS